MSLDAQSPTTEEAVDAVLARAGLPINQDEYERLLRTYPVLRESGAALRIPEARYAEPAMTYSVGQHA